jgi:excisionase family DNA binding protein
MSELISVSEAAGELARDPSRVRALVASGQLPGVRIGRSWALDRAAVERRKRARPQSGRPFEPHNAWALLFLASGREVEWVDAGALWRLRGALYLHGVSGLGPRLGKRADAQRFHAHPGELSRVLEDGALVRSGISAAAERGLGLVSGDEVDGYVRSGELDRLRREHALEPEDVAGANVLLRVVPDSAWHLEAMGKSVPLAVVALDLAEDPDPRSARAGAQALKSLDSKLKRRPR